MKKLLFSLYKKVIKLFYGSNISKYDIVRKTSRYMNNQLHPEFVEIDGNKIYLDESDSLFLLSLNGADGKYGFLDIIKNYKGTDAANISLYSAGMAYYHLNDFKNSIEYLNDFDSEDEILNALALGVIGDSFAELDQLEDALDSYDDAINSSTNDFTSPKFLLKAGNIASSLGKKSTALDYYKRIKEDYSKSSESFLIDIQIEKNSLKN